MFRALLILLVVVASQLMPATSPTSPSAATASQARREFTVRLRAGEHIGLKFDASGRVTDRRRIALGVARSFTGTRRGRPDGDRPHLRLSSGPLAGYWVRESANAFIPGKVGEVRFEPKRLKFEPGAYAAFQFAWNYRRVADRRHMSLEDRYGTRTTRKAFIDGVRHQYVSRGTWAGWWIRFADGMRVRRIDVPLADSPVANGPVVGYGRGTVGGEGGKTLTVTNLDDSGPGSLRAALEASGRRTVVFEVAGTIRLRSSISITDPFLTVAGGTAPAPGITVRGGGILVRADEVILRHLRLRPGDQVDGPSDVDALTINGARGGVSNVVVDHVTMLWGPDIGGLAVLGDVSNLTVQNSIMGEGLYLSAHGEGTAGQGGHSMAANVTQLDPGLPGPERLTFWHNLFTTSDSRMPRFQGAACVDVVNNVIYNWGTHSAHGNPRSLNLVGNWYRSGPETESQLFWRLQTSDVSSNPFDNAVYLDGNVADGIRGGRDGSASLYAAGPRCGGLSVAATGAQAAYDAVLASAGATAPVRDEVDRRVIANVIQRNGRFFNGAGHPSPNPYYP
jgi:pectate lyase